MKLVIAPANPAAPSFVGELSGIDPTKPLAPQQISAIEAGMARYGVLVLRNQPLTDDQQIAFSRYFGPLEDATGDLVQG